MVVLAAGFIALTLIGLRMARYCYAAPLEPAVALPYVPHTDRRELGRKEKEGKKGKSKHGKSNSNSNSKSESESDAYTTAATFPRLQQRHVVLSGAQVKQRVVIVGDVHGCQEELVRLLEKCKVDANTTVIIVGDLVNKGPYSAEVVAYVRKNAILSVRGNHDEALLKDIHGGGDKYDYSKNLTE
jgi:hypothetical protein